MNNLVLGLPRPAKEGEPVALDIELFQMDKEKLHRPTTGRFACLSVSFRDTTYQFTDEHDIPEALERIKKGQWIFTNATFDIRQLRRWAKVPQRKVWDTMLAEQELFGGYYTQFGLQAQSLRWLDEPMEKETRDEFTTATEMDSNKAAYAAGDADASLRVAQKQWQYIRREGIPVGYYWECDEPCIWATLDMPPVRIDVANWSKLAAEFAQTASNAREVAMREFSINIASGDQLKPLLSKLTKRQIKDAQAGTLEELREDMALRGNEKAVALLDLRSEFQHANKLASTYGQNWLDQHIEDECYVYSNWKICGASDTGRMSSSDPNLANIPAKRMPVFRTMFLSSPEHMYICGDVAQQEPRVLAKLSKDKHLNQILSDGQSPHIVLGYDLLDSFEGKKDPRYHIAKSLNLGISYGLTANGLSSRANISIEDAEIFIMKYKKMYPGVSDYMTRYRDFAMRHDYVETSLGRRCWINPHSSKWMNNAINAPIQGSAAHMFKYALAYMHRMSADLNLPFCVCLCVYDEMDADVPYDNVDEYSRLMADAWQAAGDYVIPGIPIPVELAVGDSWAAKK